MQSGSVDPAITPTPPLNLYEYALEKVRESAARRQLSRVIADTGLGESWMFKFAAGKIPGASYEKIDQLARYYLERDAAAAATFPKRARSNRAGARQ